MSEELKTVLQGAIWRELEQILLAEADALANRQLDRSKSYEEQGKESHVNELAANTMRGVIKSLASELNIKEFKTIDYD
jgi:hypothetical protein